jgi:shikimate kinase
MPAPPHPSSPSATARGAGTLLRRIVLTGFMGAGKSTVGPALAVALGWQFLDLDHEIVREQHRSIAEIFETSGEAAFRQIEHSALLQTLERENIVLALGGGAIETASNLQRLTADPATLLLYLEAPLDELIARCEQQHRPHSGAPRRPVLERRHELAARFHRRQPLYQQAHWTIATAGREPAAIVQAILERWREHAAVRTSSVRTAH